MSDQFPDDPNGDVLRQMRDGPREVNFSVVFGTQDTARQFGDQFQRLGYEVSCERSDVDPDLPWDVTVVNVLAPTYAGICEFEDTLKRAAQPLGGRTDGWGCFRQ